MNNASGPVGEEAAAAYLLQKGYRIAARNYRTRFGEIDIIAENGQYIVFAEVKTRDADALVGAFEAVTPAKQRRIVRSALRYLQENPTRLQPRFDVVGVVTEPGGRSVRSIRQLENAFGGKGFL